MAKAVTLNDSNGEEVYPVTDISLVNGELNGARIVNASVGSDKLTPNAVWTENIKDGAVTSSKIDWTTLTQLISQSDINSAGGSLVFGDVLIQWGSHFWGNLNTSASGFNTTTITLPKNYANSNYIGVAFQMFDTGNVAGGETKVISREVSNFKVNYSHIGNIGVDSTRIGWLTIGQRA